MIYLKRFQLEQESLLLSNNALARYILKNSLLFISKVITEVTS